MPNFFWNNSTDQGTGVQQAMTTSFKSLLGSFSSTTTPRRGKLYDVICGTNGTPADQAMEFDIIRTTGTSSGYTVVSGNILDLADQSVLQNVLTANATTEATLTTSGKVAQIPLNQRASYRWVCAPGSELVWPATASAGLVVRAKSPTGYTGTAVSAAYATEV